MSKKSRYVLAIGIIVCLLSTIVVGCGGATAATETTAAAVETTAETTQAAATGVDMGISVPDPQPRPDVIKTRAPDGSEVAWFTDLYLTPEEVEQIKAMNGTVAWEQQNLAEWTAVNLEAAKVVFAKLNIKILAIAGCDMDPSIQKTNMENFLTLKPDVVLCQPQALDIAEATFRPLIDAGIKLVLLSNVPQGLEWPKDFVGVATDDLYGMGELLAHDIAKEMGEEGKIGFLNWAQVNYVTDTRDGAFKKTILENYPNIEIIDSPIGTVDEAAPNAAALITKYPDIKGFYTPWAGPASYILEPIRASGRTDILSVTHDLDDILALDMAQGGATFEIASDLTYNLGWIRAMMVGYALLGKEVPAMYTIVGQMGVKKDNLVQGYNICYRKDPLPEVMAALEK